PLFLRTSTILFIFVFFFQAEDGIRDRNVTGVQTCALPISLVIVDELHVVTDRVWEAMSLASGKRLESLTLAISTPSDRLDSVMWRLVEYGRQHPDDKSFRLVEYGAPDGCNVDDRDAWRTANPALGDFLHVDALETNVKTTPEASCRRYRLGQWVGAADSWLPWGAWDEVAGQTGTPDE